MFQNNIPKPTIRAILILAFIGAGGVICAFYFGLGWFFLIGTVLWSVTLIQFTNEKIRGFLLGKHVPNLNKSFDPKLVNLSKILRILILLGWSIITIVAFVKLNIPLKEIFNLVAP